MATRSQVREVVTQLLYAYGSGNDGIAQFIDEILQEHKIKNAQNDFAKTLFFGALENLESLDLRIKHQIKNWEFERVGAMERAILRLGAYEIVCAKIDKAIAINEALELTKSFCSETSVKFVNGILDGIANNTNLALEIIQESLKQESLKKSQKKSQETQVNKITQRQNKPPHKKSIKAQPKDSKHNKIQNKTNEHKTQRKRS